MNRDDVVERIQELAPKLRARGVADLSLFGSTARGEAGPKSDIDVMVRFVDGQKIGLFVLGALQEMLEKAFPGQRIDLLCEPIQTDSLRRAVEADRYHVFG